MEDNTNQSPVEVPPPIVPEEAIQPVQPSTPTVELPTQPITPPLEKPVMQETPKPKSKLLPFLITFLIVIVLGLLGYLVYTNYFNSREQSTAKFTPIPEATIDPTVDWKTYKINILNLSFKLPPELINQNGDLKERIISGEKGTLLSVSSTDSKVVQLFNIGTTSIDYEEGRSGVFSDLQGYKKDGDKYLAKFVQGRTFTIPTDLVTEKTSNNIKMIRILGQNYTSGEYLGPIEGTPGEGYVGAILNIPFNDNYTGLTIHMKLNEIFNVELFDQILSTFKFYEPSPIDLTAAKEACIKLQSTSKYWNDIYNECLEGRASKVDFQTYCSNFNGKFEDDVSTCRHAQPNEPCGPEPTYICSFN
jgi:hypothetical protein